MSFQASSRFGIVVPRNGYTFRFGVGPSVGHRVCGTNVLKCSLWIDTRFQIHIPHVFEFMAGQEMNILSCNDVRNFEMAGQYSSVFTHVAAHITFGSFFL